MSECDYLSNYEAIVLFCLEWYRASSLKKILCYIAEYSRDQFSGQQQEKSDDLKVLGGLVSLLLPHKQEIKGLIPGPFQFPIR